MALAASGLVGRDRELSTLEDALDRLVAGRGGVVWVTGEPGIGKSSLVAALTAAAAGAGCEVRAGGGIELTEAFPLRLMADCLDTRIDSVDAAVVEIARLMRGDPEAPAVADPVSAAAERMLGVVDRLCAVGPVILVAEDLHWADPPSLGLWRRLARSVDQIPLLLVGSCRPVPVRPALQRLSVVVQESGGLLLELGPLSHADAVAAAGHLLAAQPGPRLSAELARTGGNPLYVRELVTALRRDASIRVVDGDAELVHTIDTLPESLVAAIGRQLTFLTGPTRRALRLGAVLGTEFSAAEWAHVVGQSAVQLAELVQEAINSGVITDGDHRLSFRHDLIRQVLLDLTPSAVREEIHRQVARTLADAGYGADVIARHLLATTVLDDWTLTWLTDASESLLHAAPEAYEALLLRAYRMLNRVDDPRWEALASRLAQTQVWLGHDEDAEQTATNVLRHTNDKELAGRMGVQAARAADRRYHHERALALTEDGLADPTIPERWQARLRAWKAFFELRCMGRVEPATATATEALNQAQKCNDRLGAAYAYRVLAHTDRDPRRRRALIDAALEHLGDDAESADLRVLLASDYLDTLEHDGVTDEADTLVAQSLVLGEQVGAARAALIQNSAAMMHLARGNWDEALRYAAMASTETVDGRESQAITAVIMLRRDQRDHAETHLRAAGASDHPDGGTLAETQNIALPYALFVRAEADGNLPKALALGKQLDDGLFRYTPEVVRVALELDEIRTARATAARATNSVFMPPAEKSTCQALIDDDTDALLGLAEEYGQRGWRTYRAFALEEAAVRLARAGEDERARATFTDAVQLYADFGASMDIRRADSRLRRYGIRRGSRTIHHRPTHGWKALTPSELRIAKLVAEGLSNPDIAARLYVSRGTVQTHVSSILAKLHMSSRIELIHHRSDLNGPQRSDASE